MIPILTLLDPCALQLVEQVAAHLDEHPKTKLAIFDAITSNSGVVLPIKELVDVCNKRCVWLRARLHELAHWD